MAVPLPKTPSSTIPLFTLADGGSIPALGLGTWQLTGKGCVDAVRRALALGYRHIDTAMYYGNHAAIGEAIKGFPRDELFLTSKVWPQSLRKADLIAACDETLRELGTTYVDLFLIHWPNKAIPMRESFEALAELHRRGSVKGFGVSNFTVRHLEEAIALSEIPILVNQVEFHPFLRQHELLAYCAKNGIRVIAYSPLARGKTITDPTLRRIAEKHGKSPGQIALRWLHELGIVVIPKAGSEGHLRENMGLFGFSLDEEDRAAIGKLPRQRLIDPPFAEFDE